MVRKCSAGGCTSGYKSNKDKVSVYKFPKDVDLKKEWVDAMPNKLDVKEVTNLWDYVPYISQTQK
jgi:hypothetical protein